MYNTEIRLGTDEYLKAALSPSLYVAYKAAPDDTKWAQLFDPYISTSFLYANIGEYCFKIEEGEETLGLKDGLNAYCAQRIIKTLFKRIGSQGMTTLVQESETFVDSNQSISDMYNRAGKAADECITILKNSSDFDEFTDSKGIQRKTYPW